MLTLVRTTLFILVILAISTILFVAVSQAKTMPNFTDYLLVSKPERTLAISGPITGDLENFPAQVLSMLPSKEPVMIYIDSPGGYVHIALKIIDAIDTLEANGIEVTCRVTRQAASAGWLIFNACNKREALDTAFFMWHSIAVTLLGSYNILDLQAVLSQMNALQIWFNKMLQTNLMMDEAMFTFLWHTQTTLTAPHLSSLSPGYLAVIQTP
jgi:ATP-dependent protease ClpP protease subunit